MTTSTMNFRRGLALAAAATATVALAACGTDSGSEPTGGSSASPSTSGASWEEIQEEGVITVASEGTYRPFSFHEGGSGELVGYDVEVMEAVAEELGVEVRWEETQWDAIFTGLDAGRFDAIANQVTITDERLEDYQFSDPYTVSAGVVVVTEDNEEITSFEDLDGKTTAQSLTSNWYKLAEESGAEIENVEGWAQAVTLLRQGRVDATINDQLTFLDYENTEGDTGLKVAAETEERSESAVAFRQGSDDLVEAVNEALATLREDGTLTEISEKYFGEDVSG